MPGQVTKVFLPGLPIRPVHDAPFKIPASAEAFFLISPILRKAREWNLKGRSTPI